MASNRGATTSRVWASSWGSNPWRARSVSVRLSLSATVQGTSAPSTVLRTVSAVARRRTSSGGQGQSGAKWPLERRGPEHAVAQRGRVGGDLVAVDGVELRPGPGGRDRFAEVAVSLVPVAPGPLGRSSRTVRSFHEGRGGGICRRQAMREAEPGAPLPAMTTSDVSSERPFIGHAVRRRRFRPGSCAAARHPPPLRRRRHRRPGEGRLPSA